MNKKSQKLVGILISYGVMELACLFASLAETYQVLSLQTDINTFCYFLIDIFSFACGSVYLVVAAKLKPRVSIFTIASIGTSTAFVALLAFIPWPFAHWGKFSMFFAPTIGAIVGAFVGTQLNNYK